MSTSTIPELIALVKVNVSEHTTREALRELHRRGVSVTGIVPTSFAPERLTGRYLVHAQNVRTA